MNYQIIGDNMPAVEIELNSGESVYSQSGGMAWMDEGISLKTNMRGGLFEGVKRAFGGESMFMVTFTSNRQGAKIGFSSNFIGKIIPITVSPGKEFICQKRSFLVAEQGVDLQVVFTKKFTAGLLGGEGFILQKLTGNGQAFLEVDGDIVEKNLEPNQVLYVDTGNIAAFEASVNYSIERVKGVKNILFGGEGLFITKLTGPGKVWLQTLTAANIANSLSPFLSQLISS